MVVKLKIGREIYSIDENDMILDNGATYQVVTKEIRRGWSLYSPQMSKTLFKKLFQCGLIYTNEELADLAARRYTVKGCVLYKFNVAKMLELGC